MDILINDTLIDESKFIKLGYDEEYNRLLITKNNKDNKLIPYNRDIKGVLINTQLNYYVDGDIVINNDSYYEISYSNRNNDNLSIITKITNGFIIISNTDLQIGGSGISNPEYKLNNSNWQSSNIFDISELPLGKHKVTIRNQNDYSEYLIWNLELFSLNELDYDASYTLSYSFDIDRWISFHSYIPDFYFNIYNNIYSIFNNNNYKHNINNNRCKYYDEVYDSIIDTVFVFNEPIQLNSLSWITNVYENSNHNYDKTFDKLLIRNNYQSSEIINLDNNLIRHIEDVWHFNKFRDLGIKNENKTRTILEDYKPLNINTNINKRFSYKKNRFNSLYLICRFIKNNSNNEEINLINVQPIFNKTYR